MPSHTTSQRVDPRRVPTIAVRSVGAPSRSTTSAVPRRFPLPTWAPVSTEGRKKLNAADAVAATASAPDIA